MIKHSKACNICINVNIILNTDCRHDDGNANAEYRFSPIYHWHKAELDAGTSVWTDLKIGIIQREGVSPGEPSIVYTNCQS